MPVHISASLAHRLATRRGPTVIMFSSSASNTWSSTAVAISHVRGEMPRWFFSVDTPPTDSSIGAAKKSNKNRASGSTTVRTCSGDWNSRRSHMRGRMVSWWSAGRRLRAQSSISALEKENTDAAILALVPSLSLSPAPTGSTFFPHSSAANALNQSSAEPP